MRQALAMSMDMETGSTAAKSSSSSSSTAKATATAVPRSPSNVAAAGGKNKIGEPTEASRVDPVQAGWHKPKNPAPGSIASAAPAAAGPSGLQTSPISPKAPQQTTSPTKAAPAAPAMPEGPGHTLGGASTVPKGGRAGRGEKAQDDPQEIRRRRLAFLDKMAKEQKEKEQGK